ncbi:hypothetical protein CCMA1212_000101 [Trichoderma ghanense]|uniref:Uncharacterized protein n=1 Tax=Trichoderma ghanense TaxID=65468 RepID=A0ABY2HGD2_9HYPO
MDAASTPKTLYLSEVPKAPTSIAPRIKVAPRADPRKRKPFARCQPKNKIYTLQTLRPASPQGGGWPGWCGPPGWRNGSRQTKDLASLTRCRSRGRDQASRERLEAKRPLNPTEQNSAVTCQVTLRPNCNLQPPSPARGCRSEPFRKGARNATKPPATRRCPALHRAPARDASFSLATHPQGSDQAGSETLICMVCADGAAIAPIATLCVLACESKPHGATSPRRRRLATQRIVAAFLWRWPPHCRDSSTPILPSVPRRHPTGPLSNTSFPQPHSGGFFDSYFFLSASTLLLYTTAFSGSQATADLRQRAIATGGAGSEPALSPVNPVGPRIDDAKSCERLD